MAVQIGCPTVEQLRELMLGKLTGMEADAVGAHLLACAHCATAVRTLNTDDPLVLAARAGAQAAPSPEHELIEHLITRMERQPPSAPTAELQNGDTPSAGGELSIAGLLAPPQAPGELGRLGSYRILRILGAGGMGVVFEAEDPRLKRRVAVKALKSELTASALHRQRFEREAQAVAQLEHDHIVSIHQVGEDRGVLFLAMPLLRGETLEDRLRRAVTNLRSQGSGDRRQGSGFSIAETLRIGREIAEGLAAAHERGITHRDIKPANIWLETRVTSGKQAAQDERGGENEEAMQQSSLATHHSPLATRVKILDFGLARPAEDQAHLTQTGMVAGTPQYMAPEQATGAKVDHRCDLFSLGCILYRMTTVRLPFEGATTLAVLRSLAVHEPKAPRALNAAVPIELSNLILRLLAKEPNDRPASARVVIDALRNIERAEAAQTQPRRKSRWPIAGAGIVAVAVGILAWLCGPAVYRFATNQGQIVVETSDPDVEIAVTRNGELITVLDRRTGHEITLPAADYTLELVKGKPGAKLSTTQLGLKRGGTEIVQVRFEPLADADKATPFVVLGGRGEPKRLFADLAEAVAAAQSDDIIEIRGNGPFVIPTIDLKDKALTIRAAAGFVPVLEHSRVEQPVSTPTFRTRAALVLEGLHFRRDDRDRSKVSHTETMILCRGPAARVANCRFEFVAKADHVGVTLGFEFTPRVEVRNCLSLDSTFGSFVGWLPPSGGSMILENNAASGTDVRGHAVVLRQTAGDLRSVSLRLSRNTVLMNLIVFFLQTEPKPPVFSVDASENVVASRNVLVSMNRTAADKVPGAKVLSSAEVESQLRGLFAWRDEKNVYPTSIKCFGLRSRDTELPPTRPRTGLADWNEFWGLKDTGSIQGTSRFRGGDMWARIATAREKVTPEDFRLDHSSAGHGAAPGGRDLGADVDLVGPGPAYERWKKTPAYQQWLKDIGRLK